MFTNNKGSISQIYADLKKKKKWQKLKTCIRLHASVATHTHTNCTFAENKEKKISLF